jgi:hypothetical protein
MSMAQTKLGEIPPQGTHTYKTLSWKVYPNACEGIMLDVHAAN